MIRFLVCIVVLINNLVSGDAVYISDKNKLEILTLEESRKLLQTDINRFYSDKKLGSFVLDGKTFFRLFAPAAKQVILHTFTEVNQQNGTKHEMIMDTNGVWEASLDGELYGLFYGFEIIKDDEIKSRPLCIDPYTKAVATFNTYLNPRRGIVVKENNYNWEGDSWIQRDWRDLIIYEMHVRDITAHSTSKASKPGTYKGLIEKGKPGGIDYIKSLGANIVELLPSQEFAAVEIPYNEKLKGKHNTWNPYERNHWGYMTAAFFAPAAYYAEEWNELKWNTWMGKEAEAINDFKDMVKAFHKEGIGVVMDVVYNHLSEYELGNLKEIDSKYYFRLDEKGNYKSESGCGNDLKTERPMVRRMIIESILYWMKEYHVDGFRFDLGKLIDWETIEEIIREARKVNPNVVIVCEPWGGGYDPAGFSLREWGSWNDQIRNGIKGENPVNGLGWIFGEWYGNNNTDRIKSYVNGTLTRDKYGLFQKKEHSVNYLESHDGYTLGDFIRIATGSVKLHQKVTDVDQNVKLDKEQLKLHKLAALFLLTSQGIIMLSEGQEFARSKVIAHTKIQDKLSGELDHNSYNKDNETNYINYDHSEINKSLVDYYKGLIKLRNKYPAFRRTNYEDIHFIEVKDNPFALAYNMKYKNEEFFVCFNASKNSASVIELPEGNWGVLVNSEKSGEEVIEKINGKITLDPKEGFVLISIK